MSGASLIPVDAPGDHEDVADLLSIARVTWNRGDHQAAVNFVQRAAQMAMELESSTRGIELAKIAAELKATYGPAPAPASPSMAARAREYPSATATPQLILTPSRPPHRTLPGIDEAEAGRAALQPPALELMDDEPPTIPYPTALAPVKPVQGLTTDDLEDLPRDTSIDVPVTKSITGAPRPPGVSQPPRPGAPAPAAGAVGNWRPSALPQQRTSGQPPPLPSGRPPPNEAAQQQASKSPAAASPTHSVSKPPGGTPNAIPSSVAHAAARFASSPVPPKVTSVRPAAVPSGSRAPMPLRVKTVDEGRTVETPMPMVSGSADPSAVRRSYPWIDEIVAPVTGAGGTPVVVGVRARIHFNTDGSLELGADFEGATGLAVILLPQRGEDMTTILKRLAARKR